MAPSAIVTFSSSFESAFLMEAEHLSFLLSHTSTCPSLNAHTEMPLLLGGKYTPPSALQRTSKPVLSTGAAFFASAKETDARLILTQTIKPIAPETHTSLKFFFTSNPLSL